MLQNCKTNHPAFCAYVDAGFTLFPIYPGTKFPHEGFLQTHFDPEFTPKNDSNYGVLLRRRILILDCDPRNYTPGDKPLTRLLTDLGLDPAFYKETFIVKTPRGGYHIYLSKSADVRVVSALKEYPGVEFKDLHILAAGSYIEKTDKGEPVEKAYTVVNGSPKKILPAPQGLLAKIMRKTELPQALSVSIIPDQQVDIQRFIRFCKETDPAIEGQQGDLTTFKTACRGREFGLSSNMTFQTMKEFFNPRCKPKWTEEQLMVKVASAYSDPTKPIGARSVQNEFPADQVKTEKPDETHKTVEIRYHYNPGKTKLLVNLSNLKMFFQYPTIDKETNRELKIPPIGNSLAYDTFSGRIVWTKPAPWNKTANEFDEDDAVMFKTIVSEETTLDFSTQMCFDIALVCAKQKAFHPVRDYIDALKWDGTPRLDSWLARYCGAADDEYTRFVGRKTLIAAVARVFSPGCKFDHVLVLEGDQGTGKSTVFSHLASPWFTDAPLNIQDKSAVEVMQGQWIVELGEMEAHSKFESRTIKGFLTRQVDRVRMAWARKAMPFPRQNIFVGTINPEQAGWLKDPTGDRRYWPVPVFNFDLAGLKRDRDQIWAEAYEMFKRGEQIHVEDKKMRELMAAIVSARLQEDPWFGLVENYLAHHAHEYVTDGWVYVLPVEVYTRCVGGTASTCGTREYGRIATVLKQLGYEKSKAQGKHGFVYKKKHDADL